MHYEILDPGKNSAVNGSQNTSLAGNSCLLLLLLLYCKRFTYWCTL